jgi:hypothetical protein
MTQWTTVSRLALSLLFLASLTAAGAARAGDSSRGPDGDEGGRRGRFSARLCGYEEVPAVSSDGRGSFRAAIDGDTIRFELAYRDLEASVTAAHIHFGQPGVAGGVVAFLCGGGGKPACPPAPATIEGTVTASDVAGPTGQGIAAGEFDELVRALRDGMTYANVHSSMFPTGEIRGQILGGDRGGCGVEGCCLPCADRDGRDGRGGGPDGKGGFGGDEGDHGDRDGGKSGDDGKSGSGDRDGGKSGSGDRHDGKSGSGDRHGGKSGDGGKDGGGRSY